MDRSIETTEYRFNEAKHLHELCVEGEWKALTGCTTILGILAKPALIPWAAGQAVEYIENVIKEGREITAEVLKEARSAHRKKKETAGDAGTQVHALCEAYIRGLIEKCDGKANDAKYLEATDKGIKQFQHFIEWARTNNVKFLEAEKSVYSKSLFLGGIVDIVCEIDGEVWIADIKTGSGIYAEHFAQMAGYELMLKEMGFDRPIKGHIVLNLKKDGTFQEKRSVSTEDAKNFFLACVQCYRLQEKFNNQII